MSHGLKNNEKINKLDIKYQYHKVHCSLLIVNTKIVKHQSVAQLYLSWQFTVHLSTTFVTLIGRRTAMNKFIVYLAKVVFMAGAGKAGKTIGKVITKKQTK